MQQNRRIETEEMASMNELNKDATLRELLEFPCSLNYKIMGYAKPELIDKVLDVIKLYAPNDYLNYKSNRPVPKLSRNGTYHALSVTIHASTIEQVESLYEAFGAIDLVRAVL